MKIERRKYVVFIAHNNLAVFFNRYKDNYLLRINKGLHNEKGEVDKWITTGEMEIEPEQLKDFLQKLQELAE